MDVAITHSLGVVLCGYVFSGGAWDDPLPWLLSVPLLLAILPSITLSGIPDLAADAAADKRTLAVRLGHRGALIVALVFTLLSAGAATIWQAAGIANGAFDGIGWFVLPHASGLAWMLYQRMNLTPSPGRIDSLMLVSLTYVLWFGLVPLFRLA